MALYHSAKGSVDYTVVGSPTIVDGILTNVDADNRVKIANLNLGSNSFEIASKVKFSQQTASSYGVYGFPNKFLPMYIVNRASFAVYIRENSADNWSTITLPASMTPQVDIWYWWKVKHDGNGNYTFSVSTDEQNWVSATSSLGIMNLSAEDFLIGRASGGNAGSIDLNETYITVNGQPWFGVCPIEVKEHQLMGPVGYTVVGNPTIVDGVASGFSTNDYLQLPAFGTTPTTFHLHTKIKNPATFSSRGICGASTYNGNFGIIQYGDSTFGCVLVVVDGGSNKYLDITSNVPTSANAIIELDQIVDLSHLVMTLSVKQGGSVIYSGSKDIPSTYTEVKLPTNYLFGKNQYGSFDGSIDLNQTYIKVNGKLWFYQPAPTKYIVKDDKLVFADQGLYLTGPVNYTVVGSPTIVDGVASGFSSSDYLQTSSAMPFGSNYEMVIKINTPSTIPTSYTISNGFVYLFSNSGGLKYSFYDAVTSSWKEGALFNFSTNTTYYIKEVFDGSSLSILRSYNGENYTSIYSYDTTSIGYGPSAKTFVFGSASSRYWTGSIDLNETYIKVDGQLWFYGKNYASKNIAPVPAGYTYGTTTTPSIGYVDMRTQAFTAAPSGATIGRDE